MFIETTKCKCHKRENRRKSELQKRANRANQLVLFFLADANFWEKHAKNRRKHAKTGKKQALFWCYFFGGKNWSVLIFTPFATMIGANIENDMDWSEPGNN